MSRLATTYNFSQSELIEDIDINQLRPSKMALRSKLGDVSSLMLSISEKGLLYPILVRPDNSMFEVVCGNRRFDACRKLGMKSVKCVVCHFSDRKAFEISLTENLQRQSLDAMDEAQAFKSYVLEFGWGSVTMLARKIGKSKEYVSHRLLLLNLPEDVLTKVSDKSMAPCKARELIWLKDPELQRAVSEAVISHKLSVRKEHELIKLVRTGYGVQDALETVINGQDSRSTNAYVDEELGSETLSLEKSIVVLRLAMMKMGAISNQRICIDFKDEEGRPDGMTIDSEGMLWIAHARAAKLSTWDPKTGRKVSEFLLPTKGTTSVIFGGKKLDALYVTSGSDLSSDDSAGYVYVLEGTGAHGFESNICKVH